MTCSSTPTPTPTPTPTQRDLLFYHETKAKRAAKIKSKAYRKVHKKGRAKQAEREAALGELDRHTAQKLALKREVERVQERMDGIP